MSNSARLWRQRGTVKLHKPVITFRGLRISPWILGQILASDVVRQAI